MAGARHFQRTIHLANDAVLNNSEGGLGGPETSQHLHALAGQLEQVYNYTERNT